MDKIVGTYIAAAVSFTWCVQPSGCMVGVKLTYYECETYCGTHCVSILVKPTTDICTGPTWILHRN